MDYLTERIYSEAYYILDERCTLRECAKKFLIGKSTVHKDMNERLPHIDKRLFSSVRTILEQNLSERHIRGGIATRNKYLKKSKII